MNLRQLSSIFFLALFLVIFAKLSLASPTFDFLWKKDKDADKQLGKVKSSSWKFWKDGNYEINPHFGFRRYGEIRYEPIPAHYFAEPPPPSDPSYPSDIFGEPDALYKRRFQTPIKP